MFMYYLWRIIVIFITRSLHNVIFPSSGHHVLFIYDIGLADPTAV